MSTEPASYLLNSPLGTLALKATDEGVSEILFSKEEPNSKPVPEVLVSAVHQLTEYFAGERQAFELKLNPEGTDFQQKVWELLLDIPFGHTCSYLDLARLMGDEKTTRAVGSANGRNPLAVVVPCHRVIGRDNSLTGYAGGLHNKKWLLEFEQGAVQGSLF